MKPGERMAAILHELARSRQRPVSSATLQQLSSEYDGDSGRRTYRRDIAALRARGLIETDLTTPRTPNRTGVRLRALPKPAHLEFTAGEHAAVRAAARERHRRPVPTTDGRDGRGESLDIALDAIRVLEEDGEWMTCRRVAEELQLTADQVYGALADLYYLEIEYDAAFDGVLVLEPFDEETDEQLPPEQARAFVERSDDTTRPLLGYGLDTVGRFAYTLAETRDRLEIIEAELADPSPECDVAALNSARRKLREWETHLATPA